MIEAIFEWIYVAIVVFLLFGAAIFVHEWGHYIVARLCGLKVDAFAIGFGPPIYAWKKNGIEYSLRWIPAGGYVKLPQMLTSEALEGSSSDAPPNQEKDDGEAKKQGAESAAKPPAPEPLPPASPLSKILVAFAGPFMNVVFAYAIATFLYVFGLPVKVNPSIVGMVEEGSEAYEAGIRTGDRVVSVFDESVSTWDKIFERVYLAKGNQVPIEYTDGSKTNRVVLTAKPFEGRGTTLKVLPLYPKDPPFIRGLASDTGPAAKAGVQANDKIVSFGGMPIFGSGQFVAEVQKSGGVETELVVERHGTNVTLKVTPQGEPGKALIGVAIGGAEVYVVQKPGPLPWVQVNETVERIKMTIYALANSKETGVGAKDLSGPIGILSVLAAQVKADLRLALAFMILLNISLAVMNLLPIPVLDGGHIVMSILEGLRGKPIGIRAQEHATTAFALLLISFMLYVSFHDVKRFGLFKSMFNQDVKIEEEQKAAPEKPPATQPAKADETPSPAVEPAPEPAQ